MASGMSEQMEALFIAILTFLAIVVILFIPILATVAQWIGRKLADKFFGRRP